MKNGFDIKIFPRGRYVVFVFFAAATLMLSDAFAGNDGSLKLAVQLSLEKRHSDASIEYRRLALGPGAAVERGSYWWMAAYESWADGRHDIVSRLLDYSEDATSDLFANTMLLRGENAFSEGNYDEAEFYFSGMAGPDIPEEAAVYLSRRRAAAAFKAEQHESAGQKLDEFPGANADGISALRAYERGSDKKPMLGGALGIIPGLGYVYAGEYANALRCLILNSIFIYGMVETAERDMWGVFTVITFFELTWYTGSIYGGIDASHRYNRTRREECLSEINSGARFAPDFSKLPLLFVSFDF